MVYPSLKLMLCICDPLTIIRPRCLVIQLLSYMPITQFVLLKIKFIDLSQLLISPYTYLPPLNLTTTHLFYSYFSLIKLYFGILMFRPIEAIQNLYLGQSIIQKIVQYLSNSQHIIQIHTRQKQQNKFIKMRQFQTSIYPGKVPFGTSLFHRSIQPKDQSFLQMARFTFFPYFVAYSFCFFWVIVVSFVFFYSQSYRIPQNYVEIDISQAALFELGENYPYHIVRNFHYYRVLTSMVLFRNFHHYFITCLGIITLGSYIEKAIGFKRCFVLAIVTGVSGILANNVFNKNATIESITPVTGIIGYSFGYFLVNFSKDWRYYINEKINMIFLLLLLCYLHTDMIIKYSNVNLLSNVFAMIYGFLFCFADPGQDKNFRLKNIFVILIMCGFLTIVILLFFFHTSPSIIQV